MEQDYYGRSKSYGPGMMHNHNHMEITNYYAPPAPPRHQLQRLMVSGATVLQMPSHRCLTLTTTSNLTTTLGKLKKGKNTSGSSSSKAWSMADPEFQRKKRVASYKMYSVEGKVKGSFRNSFWWLKDRYTQMLYGSEEQRYQQVPSRRLKCGHCFTLYEELIFCPY